MSLFSRFRRSIVTKAPTDADVERRAAPQSRDVVAVEISDVELDMVKNVLRAAWLASGPSPFRSDGSVPEMIREFDQRTGAAAAYAHRRGGQPRGIALLETEIGHVETAVRILDQLCGPAAYRERLLVKLHNRLGYARAIQYLDSLPVISHDTSMTHRTGAPPSMTAEPVTISRSAAVSGTAVADSDINEDHHLGDHEACTGIQRRYDLEHVDCDGRVI